MNFRKLRERRLVQWSLAYIAGAWLVLQVVNTLAGPWNIPPFVERFRNDGSNLFQAG